MSTVTVEIPELAARNIRSLIEARFREELAVTEELEAQGADRDHIDRVIMDSLTEQSYRDALDAINKVVPQ